MWLNSKGIQTYVRATKSLCHIHPVKQHPVPESAGGPVAEISGSIAGSIIPKAGAIVSNIAGILVEVPQPHQSLVIGYFGRDVKIQQS